MDAVGQLHAAAAAGNVAALQTLVQAGAPVDAPQPQQEPANVPVPGGTPLHTAAAHNRALALQAGGPSWLFRLLSYRFAVRRAESATRL